MNNAMKKSTFNSFRTLIYERSGISLGEKKEALVAARVGKRTRFLGFSSAESYLKFVENDNSGDELVHLLDAISTNVTHFFREAEHFDFIAKKFSDWYKNGRKSFRFWSAGCSSGEEPYTLAMTLLETLGSRPLPDIRILATDLSTKVLSIATNGLYDRKKVEGLSRNIINNYFEKSSKSDISLLRISDQVRTLISFARLNLSHIPFPMSGPMDLIMCRNVMIYFDQNFRKRLVEEFHRLLDTNGYLFIGHSESLTGMTTGFKVIAPSVYVKI